MWLQTLHISIPYLIRGSRLMSDTLTPPPDITESVSFLVHSPLLSIRLYQTKSVFLLHRHSPFIQRSPHHPSTQYVAFLSSSHPSHYIPLSSSPTCSQFSLHAQTFPTQSVVDGQPALFNSSSPSHLIIPDSVHPRYSTHTPLTSDLHHIQLYTVH